MPKTPPAWLGSFIDYAKTKEKKIDVKNALQTFEDVLSKRWNRFVETVKEEKANEPERKKRKVDPIKSFETAMKKVAKHIDEEKAAHPDSYQRDIGSKLQQVVPSQVQELIVDYTQVLAKLDELSYEAECISDQWTKSKVSALPEGKEAIQAMDKIQTGLEDLKKTIQAPSFESGNDEEQEEEEDEENETDEQPPQDDDGDEEMNE